MLIATRWLTSGTDDEDDGYDHDEEVDDDEAEDAR